jgi:hypothetical protein
MIGGLVDLFVICVVIGLGIAAHSYRDCVMALEDRLDRVEKLQRKQAVTLVEHELEFEVRDHRRAAA